MSPITKNVIDQLSIVSPPLLLMLLNHSDLLLKQLLPARRKLENIATNVPLRLYSNGLTSLSPLIA
jgi:hypothetical protein